MSALGRGFSLLICTLALTACQEDGPRASESEMMFPDLLTGLQASCERDNGRWGTAPGEVGFVCYKDTQDAGKSCSKASSCEGVCLARSRTCSPVKPFFGCHQVLSESGFPQTLCVE